MAARTLVGALAFSILGGCAPLPDTPAELDAQPVPDGALGERSDHPRVPLALTASDGTELELLSIRAEAVIEQPLAFTELHLVFENAEDRTIEGRFRIELPARAAISRFAMRIGDDWQEGEVVERKAARQAYEDFLHRRQDPALLEHEAGNSFGARVFPIGAREKKELIVSYSEELPSAAEPYRIALRGLPELASFDAKVIRREHGEAGIEVRQSAFAETTWTPSSDLVIESSAPTGAMALRHRELAVARIRAEGDAAPTPLGSVAILFDTSASRAVGFDQRIHQLGELVRALVDVEGGDFPLRVIAFDQTSATIHDGTALGFGTAQQEALAGGRALGASDLGAALDSLADDALGTARVIVVTDGIVTAGATQSAELQAVTTRLAEAGVDRIDAVLDGGTKDDRTLRALTSGFVGAAGLVVDAGLPVATIADKLAREVLAPVPVDVPGASWVWPRTLEGVQPGDELLVYARIDGPEPMRIELAGRAPIVPLEIAAERPLLERAWVRANIERLLARRDAMSDERADTRAELEAEIVALSVEHRVLSELTALLVLESEADYQRYGIDRRALADILTVGASGTTVLRRHGRAELPATSRAPTPVELDEDARASAPEVAAGNDDQDVWGGLSGTEIGESYGAGGLGLVGTGRGGGGTGEGTIGIGSTGVVGSGSGSGAGFGGRGARVPTVRMSPPEVSGSLEKNVIRRVVRAHINEVRACYNQGLARSPELAGRVSVQFTIGETGKVTASVVRDSDLPDSAVAECMAKVIRRWQFPAPPGGGSIIVGYPFVLRPADGEAATTAAPPPAEPRIATAPPRGSTRVHSELAGPEPYSGRYADFAKALAEGKKGDALRLALAWREHDAGDVLALVALGEIAQALGDRGMAMRAYGSIIDLHPSRADLRRYAGARLESLGEQGLALALDTYTKARDSRPDHPTSHRLLAIAHARRGDHVQAATVLHDALSSKEIRWERFPGARALITEDLAQIGAAWLASMPAGRKSILATLAKDGIVPQSEPSTRFVLGWETDANDVDFHIEDGYGGHAFYSHPTLPSGGQLLADITTGYGPEQFAIDGTPKAGPYRLSALYYRKGPMGFGMGELQIITHDGKGGLGFETRPFVIMNDGGRADLGMWEPG